jgi:hypothetical protein
VFRHRGRQHKESYPTLVEAREAQGRRRTEVASGEFSARANVTLHEYAREWIDRYQGSGRRGFREETRAEYRALLERFALKRFPPGTRLTEISPRDISEFIGWLARQKTRKGKLLSDASVRTAFKPLSVCLATARREGLIRHNPAAEAVLPHRPQVVDDEEQARPFPHGIMELVGQGLVIGALKSRYARRDIPLPNDLADRLAALHIAADGLVFTSKAGTTLDPNNVMARVLAPACSEAGVEWAGFHTSGTPSRADCSTRDATRCRCSGGSAITPPASPWIPTSTCSTAI